MAVPSFEELLIQWKIDGSTVEEPFSDGHILDFSTKLDGWEILANFVGIPPSKIDSIKAQGAAELRPMKMLECWKRRRGSKATYGAMIQALLQIDRTDLAEYIIGLIKRSSSHNHDAQAKHVTVTTNVSTQCSSLVFPPSPSSSSGAEGLSPPRSLPNSPSAMAAQDKQVKLTLEELEREFFDLVVCTEATLTKFCNQKHLEKIRQRFRMLPESIRRQYQTDDNYSKVRRRTLASSTIKELFDNLTEFKHWSYMSPEILTHILQDVPIDDMHQKIKDYTNKLATFKASTKLRDLIGISFSVPDYYIELTMIAEGWEDKTILDAEKSVVNILKRITYNSHSNPIKWKAISPGSIKLVFVLMTSDSSIAYSSESLHKVFQESGIIKMCIDDRVFYDLQYQVKRLFDKSEGLHEISESLISKEEIEPDPELRISDEKKRVGQDATAGLSAGRLLVGVGAGAGIGALFGSIVPGPGTIIGAAVGATIGGFVTAKKMRERERNSKLEQLLEVEATNELEIMRHVEYDSYDQDIEDYSIED